MVKCIKYYSVKNLSILSQKQVKLNEFRELYVQKAKIYSPKTIF